MNQGEFRELPQSVLAHYQARYPELADKLRQFDIAVYFHENPDVARAATSSEDLVRHFCEFGHRECRRYAAGVTYVALYSQAFPHLAERLREFDAGDYAEANRDVGGPGSTARDFFEHFCRHGAKELRVLRDDGRVPDRRDAILRSVGRSADGDIRVYAHLFFPDTGLALMPYLRNLSAVGARLALSFSDLNYSPHDMERFAHAVSAEHGPPPVFLTPPREGLDWGGYHRLWQQFPPDDESAVFLLHSKKSRHMAPIVGETWRNELLGPICGSYGAIMMVMEKLRAGYSMVGAALHRSRHVGPNGELIRELCRPLGLRPETDDREFVAGTMFAVRGQTLNQFFRAISASLDFRRGSSGATAYDGSMAHACERLIGYFAGTQGRGIAWVL
jgi:hypothetical protein